MRRSLVAAAGLLVACAGARRQAVAPPVAQAPEWVRVVDATPSSWSVNRVEVTGETREDGEHLTIRVDASHRAGPFGLGPRCRYEIVSEKRLVRPGSLDGAAALASGPRTPLPGTDLSAVVRVTVRDDAHATLAERLGVELDQVSGAFEADFGCGVLHLPGGIADVHDARTALARVDAGLLEARRMRDAVWLLCLRDKRSQIWAASQMDSEAARGRVLELAAEANQCVQYEYGLPEPRRRVMTRDPECWM